MKVSSTRQHTAVTRSNVDKLAFRWSPKLTMAYCRSGENSMQSRSPLALEVLPAPAEGNVAFVDEQLQLELELELARNNAGA